MEETPAWQKQGDEFYLALEGAEVSQCLLDYAFGILFSGPNVETSARIESEFSITDSSGSLSVDPETQPDLMGLAFAKLHKKAVSRVAATKLGVLTIHFDNGAKLVVRPNERYEAWSLGDLCCPPGGFVQYQRVGE